MNEKEDMKANSNQEDKKIEDLIKELENLYDSATTTEEKEKYKKTIVELNVLKRLNNKRHNM